MTAAGDNELDAVRAHLAAMRLDAMSAAESAQISVDLARIRADLHRFAEAHAEEWARLGPLGPSDAGNAEPPAY